MAVATSEASARVGVGPCTIDSSIWVATMTGLPCSRHSCTSSFCRPGTSSCGISTPRSPLATMIGVGQTDDVLDPLQRLRLLDLGEQGRPAADQPARLDQVGGLLDEGEGDEIDPELEAEGEVRAVLGGQRRQVEGGVGQVDALAVADRAADHHPGLDRLGLERDGLEPHPAVVDQQRRPRQDRLEDLGMRQRDRIPAALLAPEHEAHGLAGGDLDLAVLDQADPDLGALQVLQDGDRAAGLALERADGGVDPAVVVVRPVAEVQPEHVGPGQEQLAEPLRGGAGRPDGGDDLGVTMAAHGVGSYR